MSLENVFNLFKHIPPSFLMSVLSPGLILALVGRPGLCESDAGVAAISPSQRRSKAHNSPRIASRSTSWESTKTSSTYVAYFTLEKKDKKIHYTMVKSSKIHKIFNIKLLINIYLYNFKIYTSSEILWQLKSLVFV